MHKVLTIATTIEKLPDVVIQVGTIENLEGCLVGRPFFVASCCEER